ncbi:MAG: hypothetical protein AB7V53_17960 [Dongiaceae bacterium]
MVYHRPVADRPHPSVSPSSSFCFSVHGDADIGVLARLLEVVAKRGLLPARLHSDLVPETAELLVDLQLADLPLSLGEEMARAMRRIVGVRHVLTAVKIAAEPLALTA